MKLTTEKWLVGSHSHEGALQMNALDEWGWRKSIPTNNILWGEKSTREKSAFSGFSMSRLQMFRISRQELYKPCNVYKDQNERDMGSIMWLSGYWRPPLYAVWLGGPGVPQSPFSQAQEGPPGTRGPCLFTQLGPQAVCGTRPNRLFSYSLHPTQTHTPSCKTWLCLF